MDNAYEIELNVTLKSLNLIATDYDKRAHEKDHNNPTNTPSATDCLVLFSSAIRYAANRLAKIAKLFPYIFHPRSILTNKGQPPSPAIQIFPPNNAEEILINRHILNSLFPQINPSQRSVKKRLAAVVWYRCRINVQN